MAPMAQPPDFNASVAALGAVECLDVDAMRLLLRVERAGEAFYNGVAERIGDPRAAELLRRNGREERGHAERVRRAIRIRLGHAFEPSSEDLAAYPVPLPPTIPLEIFPQIVQAELDGDVGYQRWADREDDPEVQRLLALHGREETVHGEGGRQVIALISGRASA